MIYLLRPHWFIQIYMNILIQNKNGQKKLSFFFSRRITESQLRWFVIAVLGTRVKLLWFLITSSNCFLLFKCINCLQGRHTHTHMPDSRSLISFPNTCNSQGWARLDLWTMNSSQEVNHLNPPMLPLIRVCQNRSQRGEGCCILELGIIIWDGDILPAMPNTCPTLCFFILKGLFIWKS